jgi:hypothetical protein
MLHTFSGKTCCVPYPELALFQVVEDPKLTRFLAAAMIALAWVTHWGCQERGLPMQKTPIVNGSDEPEA